MARLRTLVPTLVMTTNGHRLVELAAPLAAAGLAGVNVSIDTLDPERFATLTGGGELARVACEVLEEEARLVASTPDPARATAWQRGLTARGGGCVVDARRP